MSIWELPIPPVWWWLLVSGIIILFIYLLKGIFEDIEEEYVPPSVEEKLRWKIIQLKFFEIIAWIFVPLGFVIYVYGIVNSSPFVIFVIASCLMIVGYVVATYYRKQRLTYQEELEKKARERI